MPSEQRDKDDQQVWVCINGNQVFHTDPDCSRIVGSANGDWTREEAEQWGKTECAHCDDAIERTECDRSGYNALDDMNAGDLAPTAFDQEAADD